MNIYFPALPAVHTARSFDNTAKLARDEASMEFYNLFRRTSSTYNHLVNWKNKTIKNLKLYRLISVENGFASLMIAPGRKLLELHFEYTSFIIHRFARHLNIWRSINCHKLRSFLSLKNLSFIFGYYVSNCCRENYIIKDWITVEMIR